MMSKIREFSDSVFSDVSQSIINVFITFHYFIMKLHIYFLKLFKNYYSIFFHATSFIFQNKINYFQ